MSSLELALHEAEILLGHVPPAGRIQNVWRHYHARRAYRYALCRAPADPEALQALVPSVCCKPPSGTLCAWWDCALTLC